MKYNILVNKNNPLPTNFKMGKLVQVGKQFDILTNSYSNVNILLEKKAAKAFKRMIKDANKINSKIQVIPDSGYRSIDQQIAIMDYYIKKEGKKKAYKRVAQPQTNEHHTGLAIDIAIFKDGQYIDDITANEEPIKFLHNNSPKYGFILRYPQGKEKITKVMPEAWHFRYVGKKLAKYLFKNNLTLEEYFDQSYK